MKLAEKIDGSGSPNYRIYLKKSMYVRPTSPSEILYSYIRQLNPNKSVGSDEIGANFNKISAEVISPILS